MSAQRTTKGNIGIVYLFTNDLYENERTYKFGNTIDPFERNRVQKNSTPPTYPFKYKIVVFSSFFKQIEKQLKNKFNQLGILLEGRGKGGGSEWVQDDYQSILKVFKSVLLDFPDAVMCCNNKCYQIKNGNLETRPRPNCRLDILGILDGKKIKCTKNNKSFIVKDNGILVNGSVTSLSNYMTQNFQRKGKTNQYDGYKYFKYKGTVIYELWQKLVNI